MIVTIEDIAVALGRTSPDADSAEAKQWEMWVADAVMLIEARLGDVFDLDAARVKYVVREAVAAQVRRPDDATQVAVSVDDGSVSRTYRTAAGRVTIRDEWWDLLSPVKMSGAFVIDTVGIYCGHLPWCSSMFGAVYCSCGVDIAGYPIFELADEA